MAGQTTTTPVADRVFLQRSTSGTGATTRGWEQDNTRSPLGLLEADDGWITTLPTLSGNPLLIVGTGFSNTLLVRWVVPRREMFLSIAEIEQVDLRKTDATKSSVADLGFFQGDRLGPRRSRRSRSRGVWMAQATRNNRGAATSVNTRMVVTSYSAEVPLGRAMPVTGWIGLFGIVTLPIDVESGVYPWVAGPISGGYTNSAVLAAVTADAPPGGGSNSVSMTADGVLSDEMVYVPLPGTYLAGVPYALTFWIKYVSGISGGIQWIVGSKATSADRVGSGAQTITASWVKKNVTWTPSADRTDAVLAVASYGAQAVQANLDLVDIAAVVSGDVLSAIIGGGFYP